MPRFARVTAPGAAHHVTQRGNAQRFVLDSDADRLVYRQLLMKYCRLHRLFLLGYCLMSNHVHLIVVPARSDSLPLALKHAHGRYAAYYNVRHVSSGHVWQGRYYSCPLDLPHLWAALRYTELNPVRAGLAENPQAYRWSSAAAHCESARPDPLIDLTLWNAVWTRKTWSQYIMDPALEEEVDAIRRNTHSGRPLGASGFVAGLEETLNRRLASDPGGRPRNRAATGGSGNVPSVPAQGRWNGGL
jgi:putative transposase